MFCGISSVLLRDSIFRWDKHHFLNVSDLNPRVNGGW